MLDTNPIYYVYGYLRSRKGPFGEKGTIKYVGKGSNYRYRGQHQNVKVPKNLARDVIFFQKNMEEKDAFDMEETLITKYGRQDKGTGILENRSEGGNKPPSAAGMKRKKKRIWSEESKAKLSASLTGLVKSQEHINNIVEKRILNGSYGFSDESREKMSKTRQKMEIERKEEMQAIHSKAGKANKGKPKSPEHIAAIKETWRLKKLKKQNNPSKQI